MNLLNKKYLQVSAALLICFTGAASSAGKDVVSEFPFKITQFINKHCVSCHGPKKQKGKFRLDNLSHDLVNGPHADDWHEVLDALNKGEMPPEDEKQPGDAELSEVVDLLTSEFVRATEKRRSTGGKVVMRRLTNYEYNNTLNELLALDENFSRDFPPDSPSKDGFKNNGFVNSISEMQLNNYLEAAKFAVNKAVQFDRPKLEVVDIKDKDALTGDGRIRKSKENAKWPNGVSGLFFRKNIRRTTIAWNDFPREGKVVIDVEVENIPNLKDILLHVGRIGGQRRTTVTKEVNPSKNSKVGNKTRIRYVIEGMQKYPLPSVGENVGPLLVVLNTPQKASILSVKIQGPVNEEWPPKSTRQIFIKSANEKNENVYAREIIESFMTRAWRRTVTKQEVDYYFQAYQKFRKHDNFVNAIKEFAVSILITPDFLYLVETKNADGKREKLTSGELSARLSYFLWASMPDDQLFALAKSGKIKDATAMRAEVKRMLQDERSWKFVENFTSQWLGLDRMSSVAVSPELYPGFNDVLKDDMKQESYYFIAHLLRENQSALNIINSDFTFTNSSLKDHYSGRSVPDQGANQLFEASPEKFKKINLSKGGERGGILTHAAVHLAYSNGEESHPIARGVWFVDKILGSPPPSPPENVEFDMEIEGFSKLSLKQQLAVHVEKKACARCHMKIDPFGVAFENYDVVGRYRDKVKKINEEIIAKWQEEDSKRPAPEEIFKKMDANSDQYVNRNEYIAYQTKTNPSIASKKDVMKSIEKNFDKLSTHHKDDGYAGPKNTFNLPKFITEHNKELAKIEQKRKTPFRYINIDTKVTLPDATNINGLSDLKAYILKNKKDEFAENIVRRLLSYGLGRSLEFHDAPVVKELTHKFKASDYKMGTLIENIVLSDLFQMK